MLLLFFTSKSTKRGIQRGFIRLWRGLIYSQEASTGLQCAGGAEEREQRTEAEQNSSSLDGLLQLGSLSVLSRVAGRDIGSLQFQLTSLSVRHFTLDCHLKSPDYGQRLPAVSRNAASSVLGVGEHPTPAHHLTTACPAVCMQLTQPVSKLQDSQSKKVWSLYFGFPADSSCICLSSTRLPATNRQPGPRGSAFNDTCLLPRSLQSSFESNYRLSPRKSLCQNCILTLVFLDCGGWCRSDKYLYGSDMPSPTKVIRETQSPGVVPSDGAEQQ
ncbi:unnamed protein product [Pleuronectes platessa]|uniref:Uncharacterized protein n=1 Tax=Pleuronectes platessa TaxID=8262 RepID=A0A9N7VBB9_PLEPL|nr:unnamed protein product [Pleuronectes platessa]